MSKRRKTLYEKPHPRRKPAKPVPYVPVDRDYTPVVVHETQYWNGRSKLFQNRKETR